MGPLTPYGVPLGDVNAGFAGSWIGSGLALGSLGGEGVSFLRSSDLLQDFEGSLCVVSRSFCPTVPRPNCCSSWLQRGLFAEFTLVRFVRRFESASNEE